MPDIDKCLLNKGCLNIQSVSLISTGKCGPLRTFLCITFSILSMLACFGKNFCTKLLVGFATLGVLERMTYPVFSLVSF